MADPKDDKNKGANSNPPAAAAPKKNARWLVSLVQLKGEFELDDGMGANKHTSVKAGTKFRVADAKLEEKLVANNHARLFKKADAADDAE